MERQLQGPSDTAPDTPPTPRICDACRRIDFIKALALSPAGSERIVLDADTSRFVPPLQTDCQLCRILTSTICWYHDYWSDPATQAGVSQRFTLHAFSYVQNSLWAPPPRSPSIADQEARDCHILLSIPTNMSCTDHRRECGRGEAGYVVCYPGDASGEQGLLRPQAMPEKFDYQRARLWLTDCEQNHGQSCKHTPRVIDGMKLIDCKSLQIVKAEPCMKWVALSYVWGHDSRKRQEPAVLGANPSTGPPHLPSAVSNAVRDAIDVTSQLGFQYLWVDRYCIDQQDATEMAAQIQIMGLIYRGAEVTIVAAAGKDESCGLPGVGTTPRIKQNIINLGSCTILATSQDPSSFIRKKSRWCTRGWTFQEGLLSRRRLLFTGHQTIFECNTTSWMEAVGGLEFIDDPRRIDWGGKASTSIFRRYLPGAPTNDTSNFQVDAELARRYTEWFFIAGQFTKRELSFDSDSLHAFAGIMDFKRRVEPPVLNISGLPYVLSRKAEASQHVETHLVVSLCWFHYTGTSARRRLGFPSWTWAGWAGAVRWMFLPFSGHRSCESKIRDVCFEFRDGQSTRSTEHLLRTGQMPEDYHLDRVVAFRFEARVVPSSLFFFNIREKYVGIDTDDEDDEDEENTDDSKDETDSLDETEPDLDDWGHWTVGMHKLCLKRMALPPWKPKELIGHLDDGSWGCLLLGDCSLRSYAHRRFLLVVEWRDDETATRIGALLVDQHYYMDQSYPHFFDESNLDWRRVRLI